MKKQVRNKGKENDENKEGRKEMRKEREKRGANEKKKQPNLFLNVHNICPEIEVSSETSV
jgi:hypothetical protein